MVRLTSPAVGVSWACHAGEDVIGVDAGLALTVAHWHRILDGELYAASSRVEWAVL